MFLSVEQNIVKVPFYGAFLTILDNIEITGGKLKRKFDTIFEDLLKKGQKKSPCNHRTPILCKSFFITKNER